MSLRQFFTANTWWGKLIGAFLGYLMAGPSGALLGILIGNLFDQGLASHFTKPHWHFHAEKRKEVQTIFFEATFSILGHIAKIDGHISKNEINMAEGIMQEMGLNNAQKEQARNLFRQGKKVTFNLTATLAKLRKVAFDNPALLKLFVDIQYRGAQIDGLTEQKIKTINIILSYLGFAPMQQQYRFYEDFRQSYSSSNQGSASTSQHSLAHAYAILEVNAQMTKQEIKRAYQRLISLNHPDKLIAQGLPEAMIKTANDKTQKIRKAYEQICISKGW